MVMKYFRRGLLQAVMVALSLIVLFPVFYALMSSFKTRSEIGKPMSLPSSFYLGNYQNVFQNLNVLTMVRNSIVVAAAAIILIVLLGSLAAYPIGRHTGKYYTGIYLYFLSGIMIPFTAGMVPLFGLVKSMGLMNKLSALIFVSVGGLMPITVMIFSGFVKSIPRELEEAAIMDGCGYLKVFTRIVFPLLKPATITVIIINILPVWNDFVNPLLFISGEKKRTLPIAIYSFIKLNGASDYGSIFAVSVIAMVFPVVLFLCFQDQFYKGVMAGSVKG